MKYSAGTITSSAKTVKEVFFGRRLVADFFQREYDWKEKHVNQLLEDLEDKFDEEFLDNHEWSDVNNYAEYFLGPIIFSQNGGVYSIIDGQQRLTTITLLLIFLDRSFPHMANVEINSLIRTKAMGKTTFTIEVEDRTECMKALLEGKEKEMLKGSQSTDNLIAQFENIQEHIQTWLDGKDDLKRIVPFFIEWIMQKIKFVEIITQSDDDAYKIFETMNDRGLSLTPTDLLKAFLLRSIKDEEKRKELTDFWKERIYELKQTDEKNAQSFFQHWLRAKYATSIREAKKGAEDQDFEVVATKFHQWVQNNSKDIGLKTETQFYDFIKSDFYFFQQQFLQIYEATENFQQKSPDVYYIAQYHLSPTLFYPLLMAPLKKDDDDETIVNKIRLVSKCLDVYSVIRKSNRSSTSHSNIRIAMYNLIKQIRDCSIDELKKELKKFIIDQPKEKNFFEHENGYRLRKQNKTFVKFLLARITSYIEEEVTGKPSRFVDFMRKRPKKARYEIEHIWADKFQQHQNDFKDIEEFKKSRNSLGGLILLPNQTNQSFGALPYEQKVEHYLKENLLAASLHEKCYEKNPKISKFLKESGLQFRSYEKFTKLAIKERMELYKKICEEIWSLNF